VRRGDTLWGLAATHLGDGTRFTEIANLNYGRPQPDGRTLTDSHWIYPGWTLILPATATHHSNTHRIDRATRTSTPTDTGSEYVVQPGDTIWNIAATHLGNPQRYREIYLLNRGHRQPDGHYLRDPGLIEPGWVLRLPPHHPPTPASSPTTPPSPTTHPVPTTGPQPSLQVTPSAPTSEPTSLSTAGASTPRPDTSPPAPQRDATTIAETDSGEPSHRLGQLTLGLTALAATGVLAELARRRRRQQSRRLPGQRITMPTGDAELAERTLRTAAAPVTLDTLTASLDQMIATCRDTGRRLPRLHAVLVGSTVLDLLVDDDGQPAAPFIPATAHTSGATWRLDAALLHARQPEGLCNQVYPALVSVGTTADAIVLLNLEAAGTLVIEGTPHSVRAIQRTLAVELATSPLSSAVTLVLPPWLTDLAEVADPDRVCAAPDHAGQRRAEVRAANVSAALTDNALESVHVARSTGAASDSWAPEIYLAERAPTHGGPWSGIATISSGTTGEHHWTLSVSEQGTARLHPFDLDLTAANIDDNGYTQLISIMGDANEPPAEPARSEAAATATATDEPTPVDLRESINGGTPNRAVALHSRRSAVLAALPVPQVGTLTVGGHASQSPSEGETDVVGPRILLLGSVDVLGASSSGAAPRRGRSAELLAYLALHPGATPRQIDEALWPGQRVTDDRRNSLVGRTRQWLGTDHDGQPHLLPVTTTFGYRLSTSVTCDWLDFLELAREGLGAGVCTPGKLSAALELVRGRPFLGVDPASYTWAETDIHNMISNIADLAHEAAVAHAATTDSSAARAAIVQGLLADPANEQLHRDAISIAVRRGDNDEVQRIASRLRAQLQAIDPDAALDPATTRLIATIDPDGAKLPTDP